MRPLFHNKPCNRRQRDTWDKKKMPNTPMPTYVATTKTMLLKNTAPLIRLLKRTCKRNCDLHASHLKRNGTFCFTPAQKVMRAWQVGHVPSASVVLRSDRAIGDRYGFVIKPSLTCRPSQLFEAPALRSRFPAALSTKY